MQTPSRRVIIPARCNHGGTDKVAVNLNWVCPVCGQPRGAIFPTRSYDGSRHLSCDGWRNPCGHVDKYKDVLREALCNGLN